MNISSVKLLSYGIKGLIVQHLEEETRNGEAFPVEKTHKHKAPIHQGLRDLFGALQLYSQLILKLERKSEIKVIEIATAEERFRLNCEVESCTGATYNVWTPWVREGQDFDNYSKVMDIIEDVHAETESYCTKAKNATAAQVIMDFGKYDKKDKNRKAAIEFEASIGEKSEEEILEMARQLCAGHGDMVMTKEDMQEPGENDDNESEDPAADDNIDVVEEDEGNFTFPEGHPATHIKETNKKKKGDPVPVNVK